MHGSYGFALLDPGDGPQARQTNDRVFASGPVCVVDVPVPALAERWAENIHPRHGDAGGSTAAIEVALTCELPPEGVTLATVRPDLDAFGTMAVFAMRADGARLGYDVRLRIREIAEAGKVEPRWRPGLDVATVSGPRALLVIVLDARRDVADRVAAVREWLETGSFPGLKDAVAQVRRERVQQVMLDRVQLRADGRVAVIESTSQIAIDVASRRAPVVIAVKTGSRIDGAPERRRAAICQTEPGHVDLGAVRDELDAIEPGWSGSPTTISPRGETTTLELDRLVDVVERHLIV